MEEYEVEEVKQNAAETLSRYSHLTLGVLTDGTPPARLRLHLLKEISGMSREEPAVAFPAAPPTLTTASAHHANQLQQRQREREQ
eukprot:jgi/Chlat1/3990/Chrsp26S04066